MLESSQGITPLFGSPYLYTSFNYPSPPNQPARDRYSYARKVIILNYGKPNSFHNKIDC